MSAGTIVNTSAATNSSGSGHSSLEIGRQSFPPLHSSSDPSLVQERQFRISLGGQEGRSQVSSRCARSEEAMALSLGHELARLFQASARREEHSRRQTVKTLSTTNRLQTRAQVFQENVRHHDQTFRLDAPGRWHGHPTQHTIDPFCVQIPATQSMEGRLLESRSRPDLRDVCEPSLVPARQTELRRDTTPERDGGVSSGVAICPMVWQTDEEHAPDVPTGDHSSGDRSLPRCGGCPPGPPPMAPGLFTDPTLSTDPPQRGDNADTVTAQTLRCLSLLERLIV